MLCAVTLRGPLLLVVLLPALVASAEPLRLADAVERIVERGPEQAALMAQADVVLAEVTTARMFPNPTLSLLAARAEPIFSAGLVVRLPIFGQRQTEIAAAKELARSARLEAQLGRWHLRRAARVAYYTVALVDEEVVIARAGQELADKVAMLAKERFTVGAGTRLDQEQGALVRLRALQEVSDRAAAAEVARLELARLLGVAPDALGPLGDPLASAGPVPSLGDLLDDARASQPELVAILSERAAALSRARAARAAIAPVPALELGLDLLEAGTCTGGVSTTGPRCVGPRGGLGLDLPIFNWNGGPIARAEAEARLADMKLVAARLRVESALMAAHRRWQAATVRVHFYDEGYVTAAESVAEMAREGFAAGRTGLLPLLEARRAALEARLGRAAALFDVQLARADVEETSGVALSLP